MVIYLAIVDYVIIISIFIDLHWLVSPGDISDGQSCMSHATATCLDYVFLIRTSVTLALIHGCKDPAGFFLIRNYIRIKETGD